MHAISSYRGNRPTHTQTHTRAHTHTHRTDYNTLRRNFEPTNERFYITAMLSTTDDRCLLQQNYCDPLLECKLRSLSFIGGPRTVEFAVDPESTSGTLHTPLVAKLTLCLL